LQIVVGLAMVALTAGYFYYSARNRYKCPNCGRPVRWKDVNCPHCGEDMKLQHRAGPGQNELPRMWRFGRPPRIEPPSRSKRRRG
jgi:predicted amidophosphoribosyltransferase